MSLHDLAMAAAELTEQQCLSVFPVPGCAPPDAVDRPKKAYQLFMSQPAAQFIGVPTGVQTMIVAIVIEAAGTRWFRHNFGRFPATLVHQMADGGFNLIFRMPLPPTPIIGCPNEPHRLLDPRGGIAMKGEGGWISWPAPRPYEHVTPGCIVALDAPIAKLPGWIIARATADPRPKAPLVLRPPRRGIDVIRDGLVGYVKYSRQGTRVDVTVAAGRAAGRLVAQEVIGEREAVELVVGAAVEAGLAPDEALAAARRGLKVGEN
jgi:hypothetical protein